MKSANSTILDLSNLPEQARQELTDFYQFLKKKYRLAKVEQQATADTSSQALTGVGFIGMWKDRSDMNDAAGWVREQRCNFSPNVN